ARKQERLVGGDRRRDAERRRRDAERRERLHETEAGSLVVGDDAGGNAATVAGDELDLVGLEDEVADRQDDAVVADQDARALALLAERRDRACVLDRHDLQADDGGVGPGQRLLVRLEAGERRPHLRRAVGGGLGGAGAGGDERAGNGQQRCPAAPAATVRALFGCEEGEKRSRRV